jgi:hypothetical protein
LRIYFDTSGLDALRAKVAEARAALPGLLADATREAGQWVAQNLSDAAPVGQGESGSAPPGGDAPGKLAESFFVQEESSSFSEGAAVSVRTRQPVKLSYVTQGTGIYGPTGQRIYPVSKQALYWKGADHPVRSIAGMPANDFVTPALAEMPDAQEALGAVIEELQAILEG